MKRPIAIAAIGFAAFGGLAIAPTPAGAATSVTSSGSVVAIGLTGDEQVRIDCSGGKVAVFDLETSTSTPASPAIACSAVTAVVVNGDGGDQEIDTDALVTPAFSASPTLGALLGDGNDQITETDQADTIFTGDATDVLILRPGTVTNTTLDVGAGGDGVWLTGTDVADTVAFASVDTTVALSMSGGATSSWTIANAETFTVRGGGGNDVVSLADVTAASTARFNVYGDEGDDTITGGGRPGVSYGGPGANVLTAGPASQEYIRSSSDTDTISGASDSHVDTVIDSCSLRSGGRSVTGFGGSGRDEYVTEFTANDVVLRVRPLGNDVSITSSLNRPGQQILAFNMKEISARVEGLGFCETGNIPDVAHRSIVDLHAVSQNLEATDTGSGRAIYDVTIPGPSFTSTVSDGVRKLSPSVSIGSISIPAAAPYKAHLSWTDDNQSFAHRSHRDLLFRFASDGARDDVRDRLAAGTLTRTQHVRSLISTDEYRGLDVDRTFVKYLRRPSDPSGRAYWIKAIREGRALWRFRAQLFGGNEYFSKAGGTNATYVAKAYEDVLGRKPDPSGQAYWTNKLDDGADRGSVALQFLNSPEARRRLVDDQFLRFLNRKPTTPEQTTWVAALPGATGEQDLIAFLSASTAYYDAL